MKVPVAAVLAGALSLSAADSEVWRFERLDQIGGHPTKVLGHPHVVDTPAGKAIQFNGVDDAIYIDVHPLAGAETWTWEVIFRPDLGGSAEQRFFHFQEIDAAGNDEGTRMLQEIRVDGERWCLDSFATAGDGNLTLLDRTKLHPLGSWHHIASVYDGKEFRNYVDGVLQVSGAVQLPPQHPGHTSIGTRINKRDYFKGAILAARMTRRALTPAEFLPSPGK